MTLTLTLLTHGVMAVLLVATIVASPNNIVQVAVAAPVRVSIPLILHQIFDRAPNVVKKSTTRLFTTSSNVCETNFGKKSTLFIKNINTTTTRMPFHHQEQLLKRSTSHGLAHWLNFEQ